MGFLTVFLANMMGVVIHVLIMMVQKYIQVITKMIKIYTKEREDFFQKNQIVRFWDQRYPVQAVRICYNQTITIICQKTTIAITILTIIIMTNKIDQLYNGDTKF